MTNAKTSQILVNDNPVALLLTQFPITEAQRGRHAYRLTIISRKFSTHLQRLAVILDYGKGGGVDLMHNCDWAGTLHPKRKDRISKHATPGEAYQHFVTQVIPTIVKLGSKQALFGVVVEFTPKKRPAELPFKLSR